MVDAIFVQLLSTSLLIMTNGGTWSPVTSARLHQTSTSRQRQMTMTIDPRGRQEIRVAVIAPADSGRSPSRSLFSLRRLVPALRHAVKSTLVRRLLPGCFLTLLSADSNCDAVKAPINAFDLYWRHKVHALFGPTCDYSVAPVARYTPYWNVPVLSAGALSHTFGETHKRHAEFKLLTRVGATFDGVSAMFRRLMDAYGGWRRAVLVYTDEDDDEVMPQTLLQLNAFAYRFTVERIQMRSIKYEPHVQPAARHELEEILRRKVGHEFSSKRVFLPFTLQKEAGRLCGKPD